MHQRLFPTRNHTNARYIGLRLKQSPTNATTRSAVSGQLHASPAPPPAPRHANPRRSPSASLQARCSHQGGEEEAVPLFRGAGAKSPQPRPEDAPTTPQHHSKPFLSPPLLRSTLARAYHSARRVREGDVESTDGARGGQEGGGGERGGGDGWGYPREGGREGGCRGREEVEGGRQGTEGRRGSKEAVALTHVPPQKRSEAFVKQF